MTSSRPPITAMVYLGSGGLGAVAGKVFRIGHLGWLNEAMVLQALGGAEMAMRDAGIAFTPGTASVLLSAISPNIAQPHDGCRIRAPRDGGSACAPPCRQAAVTLLPLYLLLRCRLAAQRCRARLTCGRAAIA